MTSGRKLSGRLLNILPYTYAPAITMFIILLVFFQKDIYPFGVKTIDYIDMGQTNAPMYYHVYDALRGTKSMFFDWYTAAGVNMAESVSIVSMLSPFNLFFYFVPRDNVLQSLSIFTMIKMMAMSAAMFIFLHKKFKNTNVFWKVMFSLGYAFSGFVLQYYGNSQWLDIAAVFPLLILAMCCLFEKNRIVPYVIMLASCLIMNFYSSAMVLLFLFFIGGLYLVLLAPKDKRKYQIWSFGIGTVCAIGLSAFIVLPAYNQISQSARVGQTEYDLRYFLDILNSINYSDHRKWYMLFGSALAIVIIIKGILTNKRNKKVNLFVIISILMVSLQIYFENINLIWHSGSYVGFPLRFGYMISFVLLTAACYYIPKIHGLNELSNTVIPKIETSIQIFIRAFKVLIGLCFLFFIYRFGMNVYKETLEYDYGNSIFSLMIVAFVVYVTFYSIMLHKNNRFINYRAVSGMLIFALLAGTYIFIPPDSSTFHTSPELTSKFIYKTQELQKALNIEPSRLERIKNEGNTLNANYPFILQRPGLSNYTHTVAENTQQNFKKLGYAIHYTRTLDSGGTLFSDALLNIKHTLSVNELDREAYTFVDSMEKYKLYKNNYTLPFGITVPESITQLNSEYINSFEYQNALFERMSGQNNLIHTLVSNGDPVSELVTDNVNEMSSFEYTIQINGNQALYFCPSDYKDDSITFYVEDEVIPIPSIGRENSNSFSQMFNRNMVYMGSHSNKTIKVKINCSSEIKYQIGLGILDLDKLKNFIQSYDNYSANEESGNSSLSLTVTGSDDKNILFLPIVYDKGWSCTVNGQKAEVLQVANSFMGIKLENGINNVCLSFIPEGMVIGIIISLATLCLLVAGCLLKKKFNIKQPDILAEIAEFCFCIVWIGACVLIYIVPVAYTIFRKIIFKM